MLHPPWHIMKPYEHCKPFRYLQIASDEGLPSSRPRNENVYRILQESPLLCFSYCVYMWILCVCVCVYMPGLRDGIYLEIDRFTNESCESSLWCADCSCLAMLRLLLWQGGSILHLPAELVWNAVWSYENVRPQSNLKGCEQKVQMCTDSPIGIPSGRRFTSTRKRNVVLWNKSRSSRGLESKDSWKATQCQDCQ